MVAAFRPGCGISQSDRSDVPGHFEVTAADPAVVSDHVALAGRLDALTEARAAKRLADLYGDLLQPQALATLRSTVIAYQHDRTDFLNLLDSQLTVVDIDLAYFQSRADFETRFADLQLAVGAPIDRTGLSTTTEVKP